jgi:hypothetical protein
MTSTEDNTKIVNELLENAGKIVPDEKPLEHFEAVKEIDHKYPHTLAVEEELLTSWFFVIERILLSTFVLVHF